MFDAVIAFHARVRPDAPAIVTPEHRVSFARLDADIDRVAAACADLSVDPGEAVAIDVADEYVRWLALLALARLGIASASAAEPTRLRIGDAAGAAVRLDALTVAAILTGPRPNVARVAPDPEAMGRVLRSSGTTGEAKRIGLSWRVIDQRVYSCLIAYGTPPGPWAMLTGMESILGLMLTLTAWASGNPVVLGIGLAITPALVERIAPALVALVPDQLRRWVAATPPDALPRAVRIVSGGAPVPPPLAVAVRARLTRDLVSVYGATETGVVAIAGADLLARRAGAGGYVLPGVGVEIVDAAGVALPPGTPGILRIRNERTVNGYLDGAAPGTSWFEGGWFVPGDIARIEADGLLLIEGRIDDLMNIGGHKLLPGRIEAAALACPGVADAAAFATADGDGGEGCWIAIVTAPGFDESALGRALHETLRQVERLRWIAVDEIPRNAGGKILRDPLRKAARARFG